MNKKLFAILIAPLIYTNSATYAGFRTSIDMSTNTLQGKLSDTITNIKNNIIKEKNEGKLSQRTSLGLSLESFFGLGFVAAGFCIDAGKSFRKKDIVDVQDGQETKKFNINSSSVTLGTYGVIGFNFSMLRLLFFVGPHGQYMKYTEPNSSKVSEHQEWQWTPMIGIGPQVRLGMMVVELRYMHPASLNLFKQGKNTLKDRVVFNKKGAGTLSLAALIRI